MPGPRPRLRVAAAQLQSNEDVDANLTRVRTAVDAAVEGGAQVVLLPENFAYFGSENGKRELAEDLDAPGPITRTLSELASSRAIHLIAGGMPERSSDPDRPYNTAVVFGPEGTQLGAYRKLHLFDVELPDGSVLRESDATRAGDQAVVVDIGGYRFGLCICYDIRFSGLFAALARQGAEVLVVPAAFTLQTGKDHWHVLLRARAIEWQTWVVAAAQWGEHPRGRRTYGHSLIVDPWGTVVTDASDREGIVVADLDLELLQLVRARIPCASHRREL